MAKDASLQPLSFREVCDKVSVSGSHLFFFNSKTRPASLLAAPTFSSSSPRLVPKPSTIHQRVSRPRLCNNSAISGGNTPSQCMRQHLFLINWAEQTMCADKQCQQPTKKTPRIKDWYTNEKLNYRHHWSGDRFSIGIRHWKKSKKESNNGGMRRHSQRNQSLNYVYSNFVPFHHLQLSNTAF